MVEYDFSVTGDCYENSARLLLEGQRFAGWILVHGHPRLTRPPFRKYGHAWLESDRVSGVAHDATHGDFPRTTFYRVGNIDLAECRRYTMAEALSEIDTHEHWGPWPFGQSTFKG